MLKASSAKEACPRAQGGAKIRPALNSDSSALGENREPDPPGHRLRLRCVNPWHRISSNRELSEAESILVGEWANLSETNVETSTRTLRGCRPHTPKLSRAQLNLFAPPPEPSSPC